MPEEPKVATTYRIARTITQDGLYEVTNAALLEHAFKSLMDVPVVKFKTWEGVEHTKHCLWCQDINTGETMFIPKELLEETEPIE